MTYETFEMMVATVPGIQTQRHAHILYGLVRWLQPEVVVETGSWKGYSSCWLARGLQDVGVKKSMVVCIDDYTLQESSATDIHNALSSLELSNSVHLCSGDSKDPQMWPGRVDMAYIDGDHSLEGVQTDCRLAIERGAHCLVIHDTVSWWGPRQVLDWVRSQGFQVLEVGFDEGLAICLRNFVKPPETYTQEKYPTGKI